jgi:hypothetical protein
MPVYPCIREPGAAMKLDPLPVPCVDGVCLVPFETAASMIDTTTATHIDVRVRDASIRASFSLLDVQRDVSRCVSCLRVATDVLLRKCIGNLSLRLSLLGATQAWTMCTPLTPHRIDLMLEFATTLLADAKDTVERAFRAIGGESASDELIERTTLDVMSTVTADVAARHGCVVE